MECIGSEYSHAALGEESQWVVPVDDGRLFLLEYDQLPDGWSAPDRSLYKWIEVPSIPTEQVAKENTNEDWVYDNYNHPNTNF